MYNAHLPSSNVMTTPSLNRNASIMRGIALSFHLLIMTIRPKAICLPSDTSSGGSQFSMLIALSLSIITVGWTGFAKMSKS